MPQEGVSTTGEESRRAGPPVYEPPTIKVMTEREILNEFQITQSMANWWVTTMC